jgi:hypothetical protein
MGNMNSQQQQSGAPGAGGPFVPAFGQFMNDQTTQMGVQFAGTAFNAGQAYMQKELGGYLSSGALKLYFNVTTTYVIRKLLLVLFPWRHKPWSRSQGRPSSSAPNSAQGPGNEYYFLPPREDLNSPDMYIPVMAFITYILLSTLLAGLRGAFHPEVMGATFSYALVVMIVELAILKGGTYVLAITNESQLLDLVAYSGYKFVGVIVTLVVSEIVNGGKGTGGWVGWGVFTYTFLANAFFLVCFVYPSVFAMRLTMVSAPLSKICPPPRLLGPSRKWNDTHRSTVAEEQEDTVPLHLRICCAVCVYVDSHEAGRLNRKGWKSLIGIMTVVEKRKWVDYVICMTRSAYRLRRAETHVQGDRVTLICCAYCSEI